MSPHFVAIIVLLAIIAVLLFVLCLLSFLAPDKRRLDVAAHPTGPGSTDKKATVFIGGGPRIQARKRSY
ncbi:MAG: hypothetical protein P4L53_09375 [Candidatus Obscuribacterales bacterium]|nr:hypothetical protein [Candidatus Obscuribacterales bacterium]